MTKTKSKITFPAYKGFKIDIIPTVLAKIGTAKLLIHPSDYKIIEHHYANNQQEDEETTTGGHN